MKKTIAIIIAVLLLLWTHDCFADTHAAASASRADVVAAIGLASNGDTVTVPSGTETWSSRIDVNLDNLTIQGNGVGNTIISSYGFQLNAGYDGNRITGFKFISSNSSFIRVGTGGTGGTPVTGWMIDGCEFDYGGGSPGIGVWDGSTGVIANNYFASDSGTPIWLTGRNDASWSTASFIGEEGQYTFVEDNHFVCTSNSVNHVVLSRSGGSYVFRCNETSPISGVWKDIVDVHGAGHGTGQRSGRSAEVYGNHFDNTGYGSRSVHIRGGTGRLFANRWVSGSTSIQFNEYRLISVGLSMAYPTDTEDCSTNSSTCSSGAQATCCVDHEGYPCCDQVGRGRDGYGSGGDPQLLEPFYVWDNKTDAENNISVTVASGNPSTYIVINRDYYNGSIPSGYEPYTYPHPDRGLSTVCTCLDGANSYADTGIEFWTGNPEIIIQGVQGTFTFQ